jgi:hypothetical protein
MTLFRESFRAPGGEANVPSTVTKYDPCTALAAVARTQDEDTAVTAARHFQNLGEPRQNPSHSGDYRRRRRFCATHSAMRPRRTAATDAVELLILPRTISLSPKSPPSNAIGARP